MRLLRSAGNSEIQALNVDGFDIAEYENQLAVISREVVPNGGVCASLGCKTNDCTAQNCQNNTCGNNYCVGQVCGVQDVCSENTCISVSCPINYTGCAILVGGCPSNYGDGGGGDGGGGDGGGGDGGGGDGGGDGIINNGSRGSV